MVRATVPCGACTAPVIKGIMPDDVTIFVNAKWARLGQYVFMRDGYMVADPYGRIPARHYYRHRCQA